MWFKCFEGVLVRELRAWWVDWVVDGRWMWRVTVPWYGKDGVGGGAWWWWWWYNAEGVRFCQYPRLVR